MAFDLFGIPIHEFDVAITDILLFIETILFSYFLYRSQSTQIILRRLLVLMSFSLGMSSLTGALFHAFFPAKATTAEGFAVWMFVVTSIGITACFVWCINALILKGVKFFKTILPFVVLYMVAFIYVIFFINYQFKTIILFYAPPMIVLALVSLVKFLRDHNLAWIGVFTGVILSFVAATIQYLQIGIHPVYFNFNAVYHVIQGISLAIIFLSFRSVLRETSGMK
ncbi:MAG: hypothetical protein EXS51_01270 [Candidatus Taylorbacteria bacterium]|nr:hypothetical protein [Candidatus Taylorbacteria bacterium]